MVASTSAPCFRENLVEPFEDRAFLPGDALDDGMIGFFDVDMHAFGGLDAVIQAFQAGDRQRFFNRSIVVAAMPEATAEGCPPADHQQAATVAGVLADRLQAVGARQRRTWDPERVRARTSHSQSLRITASYSDKPSTVRGKSEIACSIGHVNNFDPALIQRIDQRLPPDVVRKPFDFEVERGGNKDRTNFGSSITGV